MIYFSLNTRNYREKRQAQHITKQIRTLFGAQNVEAQDFTIFRTITISGDRNLGWVDFTVNYAFCLSRPLEDDCTPIKIPLDMMETLYL